MELIYTNTERLNLQTSYNETWAKAVNGAIEALKNLCGELTDAQVTTFLLSPSSLADELVATARKEFDAYVANVPESVRLSMTFNDGGKADAIKKLHRSLMTKKLSSMIDKTSIIDGICVVDSEALKEACSIYGNDKAKRVYEMSVKAAKALNDLQAEIAGNNAFADAVECWGRWQGFISISDDKTEHYKPNPNLLNTLVE